MRGGALPSLSSHLGRHLGVNGDHVAAIEYDDQSKVRELLGLPGYADFFKGKPITTMSYDWYAGRPGHQHDGTRFTLQEIYLSQLTNFLYDDGRGNGEEPSFWGREKKRSIATWSRHIEILAMVEDTHDGTFYLPPPLGGDFVRSGPGPVGIGLFDYDLSEQSIVIREAADAAIQQMLARAGLGRFLKLSETRGAYRRPSARWLPHGRLGGPRHGRPPVRGLRLRGALLHGLLGDSDEPRGQSLASQRPSSGSVALTRRQ
jgi:hypothetical protein